MFALRSLCAPAVTAALLSGLLLANGAEAAPRGKFAQARAANPTQAAGANAQVVAQLKATRALLHKANHDYKGHRVKAMHDITKAIHALQPGKKHPHKKTAKPAPGQGNNEPQDVSDGQLRQAIQQLQAVQAQLGSSQGGNVATANAAIGRAIRELQTALKIN